MKATFLQHIFDESSTKFAQQLRNELSSLLFTIAVLGEGLLLHTAVFLFSVWYARALGGLNTRRFAG